MNFERNSINPNNDDEQRYFEKYKLMANYVFFQYREYWMIYSIFIAAIAILLLIYAQAYNALKTEMRLLITFFGLSMCLVWLIISKRCVAYIFNRLSRAKKILIKTRKGKFKKNENLELWDDDGRLPKTDRLGNISSTKVSLGFIYLTTIIWGLLCDLELSLLIISKLELHIDSIYLLLILLGLGIFSVVMIIINELYILTLKSWSSKSRMK